MKPIYFPFTFISPIIFESIQMLFSKTVLYQPSANQLPEYLKKLADEGFLEIRTPFTGDEERLERLIREYKAWVEQHKGSDITFFKNRLFNATGIESIPMYSETSTSQIKSDIKRGVILDQPPKPDPDFAARLFLVIAQQFDIQHEEFKWDMEKFHLMETSLFSDIQGENEFSEINAGASGAVIPNDPGLHKTGQRLAAWLKVFEHDPVAPDDFGSALFITSSPAVMEHIREIGPNNQLVFATKIIMSEKQNSEKILEFQNILNENLVRLSKNQDEKNLIPFPERGTTNDERVNLKIFCFPQHSPWTLFKEKLKPSDGMNNNLNVLKFQKTFIGIVERLR
ncbi:MAG: hypothetical protein R6U27_01400 [Desulfobacterales bacterium]